MRRIASCRRARSCSSSSSRVSSWWLILLNSSPSAANSSRPVVGTVAVKSPPPSRRAALRKFSIWRCSERDTSTAKVNARTKKPSRMPPASRRLRVVDSETRSWGESTETNTGRPRKPPRSTNVPAVYSSSPSVSLLSPPLSGARRRLARGGQGRAEHGVVGLHDGVEAGEVVAPRALLARERLDAVDVAGGAAHGQLQGSDARAALRVDEVQGVGRDGVALADVRQDLVLAQDDDAGGALVVQEPLGAQLERRPVVVAQRLGQLDVDDAHRDPPRPLLEVLVEVGRQRPRGGQPRVCLALLVVLDQPEQHKGDRDHRHDDDEDEEQGEPVAEAHSRAEA